MPNGEESQNGTEATSEEFKGELIDINEIKEFFRRGDTATVYDYDTGTSYDVKASSVDLSHADVYPLTASDTDTLREIYNFKGEFTAWCTEDTKKLWKRRAILIRIDSDPEKDRLIAASQHGCPHGGGKSGHTFKKGETLEEHEEDNNYPGHFCIHFLHSKGHGTPKEDPDHQLMVRKAAGLQLEV